MTTRDWTTLVAAMLEASGITQAELGRRLGHAGPWTVKGWREARSEFGVARLEAMARATDVELTFRPRAGGWRVTPRKAAV